jgi:hypothetical protein
VRCAAMLNLVALACCSVQNVMGHMAQLRKLMGVSDDMHKVSCASCLTSGAVRNASVPP